jgi:hypothetical protein
MKIRFFKPKFDSYFFNFNISIFKLTILQIVIGEFYALNTVNYGVIITVFGITLQITKG